MKIGTLAPLHPLSTGVLGALDLIVVNATEAKTMLDRPAAVGDADGQQLARDLVLLGPVAAVVTLGAGGAAYADQHTSAVVPARQAAVYDTTGAGDAFLGALALALARGGSLDHAVGAGVIAGCDAVEGNAVTAR